MKCLILNLLERTKCYKCLFTRSKSEYWLLHSKILQWFYNVKYSKSCLSFIVVPIIILKFNSWLRVILSLQTFLQVYLIGEFIIFFKDPKVLILYTFTFCFDTPVHAHFSWRGSRKLMRYLLQHEIWRQ